MSTASVFVKPSDKLPLPGPSLPCTHIDDLPVNSLNSLDLVCKCSITDDNLDKIDEISVNVTSEPHSNYLNLSYNINYNVLGKGLNFVFPLNKIPYIKL